jgi:hypothetical protein
VLVFRCGAQAEVGSLEQQAFVLAGLRPLVRRLERELDGDGSVGGDFFMMASARVMRSAAGTTSLTSPIR